MTSMIEQEASRPGGVFVGRERELSELGTALDEPGGGRGSLFMLSGEPGIGKSRLADELAARARQRGFLVLSGRYFGLSFVDGKAIPVFTVATKGRASSATSRRAYVGGIGDNPARP